MALPKKSSTYLVESIPLGMEDLQVTQGVQYTGETLKRLCDEATESIDLTAMYWALKPNPRSTDDSGFSEKELLNEFGGSQGQALYEALENAASRGIIIRIIDSPGFDSTDDESGDLVKKYSHTIKRHSIKMEDWYNSGIMHQKIWIFDKQCIYLGSANNDWKSLTQVKELGIVVENDSKVGNEFTRYYEAWWKFSGIAAPKKTSKVYNKKYMIEEKLPNWSPKISSSKRKQSSLNRKKYLTKYNWKSPMVWEVGDESGEMFLSGAPLEVCVPNRTFDEDALVQTIINAEKSVCVCVMDFAPISLYRGVYSIEKKKLMVDGKVATPVWWPALFDALIHVVSTKAVNVRLFVSKWAHTSDFIQPYLKAIQAAADAAKANHLMTSGKFEIKRFEIPGWDSTKEKDREYPGHTRVNHTKYIVTDNRVNIGTSNMTYDYFSGTAGASFNTNLPSIVAKAQEIFDRDWESDYAK